MVVVRLIVFLSSAKLICRSTDISKCFIESLGFRDNESRLYSWAANLNQFSLETRRRLSKQCRPRSETPQPERGIWWRSKLFATPPAAYRTQPGSKINFIFRQFVLVNLQLVLRITQTDFLLHCIINRSFIQRPYKARSIANSNQHTTAELSKLLTSWLTAVTNIQ